MASTRGAEDPLDHSARIVEVPEAGALVARFRSRLDPSSAAGVPAHVTVLNPFSTPSRLTASVLRTLRQLFSEVKRFRATLSRIRRFPGALYLAPVPARPFRRRPELVFKRFPEAPPHQGRFLRIVPHLTLARTGSAEEPAAIGADFRLAAAGELPVQVAVAAVVLIERHAGR
jgi:2'-5' RNA ligase